MSHPQQQRLAEGATALGLSLAPAQHAQLLAYLDLLAKWNKVYNLTAGAHIKQTHSPALHRTTLRQLRQMAAQGQHCGQAVEQVVRQHLGRVAHGG